MFWGGGGYRKYMRVRLWYLSCPAVSQSCSLGRMWDKKKGEGISYILDYRVNLNALGEESGTDVWYDGLVSISIYPTIKQARLPHIRISYYNHLHGHPYKMCVSQKLQNNANYVQIYPQWSHSLRACTRCTLRSLYEATSCIASSNCIQWEPIIQLLRLPVFSSWFPRQMTQRGPKKIVIRNKMKGWVDTRQCAEIFSIKACKYFDEYFGGKAI